MLKEAERVLKKGGEFRFGFNNIHAVVADEELFTPEEYEKFSREQRIRRIKERSLEYLKSLNPNITQEYIPHDNDPEQMEYFFVLKK